MPHKSSIDLHISLLCEPVLMSIHTHIHTKINIIRILKLKMGSAYDYNWKLNKDKEMAALEGIICLFQH